MALLANASNCLNCPCKDVDCDTDIIMHRVGISPFFLDISHVFWFQASSIAPNICSWLHTKDVYLFNESAGTWAGDSWTFIAFSNVQAGDTVTVNGLTFTAHAAVTTVSLREFSISGTDTNDANALITCLNNPTYGVPNQSAVQITTSGVVYVAIRQFPGFSITASSSNTTRLAVQPLFSVQMVLNATIYEAAVGTPGTNLSLKTDPPASERAPLPGYYRRIASLVLQAGASVVAFARNPITDRLERDLSLSTVNCCVSMTHIHTMCARRVRVPTDAMTINVTTTGSAGFTNCPSIDGSTSTSASGTSSPWFFTGNWGHPALGSYRSYTNTWVQSSDAALAWSTTTIAGGSPSNNKDKWDTRTVQISKSAFGGGKTAHEAWIGNIAISPDVRNDVSAAEIISFSSQTVDSATIVLAGVTAGQTITINGLVFTAHATTTTVSLREFSIAGTNSADATALRTCIDDATYGVPDISVAAGPTDGLTLGEGYYPTTPITITGVPATMTVTTTESNCPTNGTVSSWTET